MGYKTQIKAGQLTGSIPTDTETAAAASSLVISDLGGILDHMASAIKRTHGAATWSAASSGSFSTNIYPASSDGASLGFTDKEWSDLYLADGGVVYLGADQDVSLTHVADTGVLLNAGMELQFRDSALGIKSSTDGQLDIAADAELEIVAPIVDINASTRVDISAQLTIAGNVIPNAAGGSNLGSATAEWGDVYLADDKKVTFGSDQDFEIEYDSTNSVGRLSGVNVRVGHGAESELQFRDSAIKIFSPADGQMELEADSKVLVDAPTFQVDAETQVLLKSDSVVLGEAGSADVVLDFNTDTNDGRLTWSNATDQFQFADDVAISSGEKLYFRDSALWIGSSADGQLDLAADTEIELTATTVDVSSALTVGGNLTVAGNLDINGTTTTIDSVNMSVQDSIIALGVSGSDGGYSTTGDRGILFPRGTDDSLVSGLWYNGTRFQLGVSATGPASGSFSAASSYDKLMIGRLEIDSSSDYVEVDTDLKIISSADIVLDPAGNNVLPGSDSADSLGASGTAWATLYVDDIDLNGQGDISMGGTGRIDLDADDDTSIRASADDVVTFEIGGSDLYTMNSTGINITDDKKLIFGAGSDASFEYDEDGTDTLLYAGASLRISDDVKLEFGTGGDASFEYDEDGNDVLLYAGAHMRIGDDIQLQFGAAGDASIEYDEDGTDQLRILQPAAGVVIAGTNPKLVIGDAGAEDTLLVFDGNAQDYRIGLDDGTDVLEFGVGATHGTTTALKLDASLNVDVAAHNGTLGLKLGGTTVTSTAAEINLLDGGTSVGDSVTLVDDDGIFVNDGGTSKLQPVSDISTYVFSKVQKARAVRTTALDANTDQATGLTNWNSADDADKEVYVNGQLMLYGVDPAANADYYDSGTANAIKFEFALAVDDVIQFVLRANGS